MNESEWLSSNDPQAMLSFLHGAADIDKIRLFSCACCRRIEYLFRDDRLGRALCVAEGFASGAATETELEIAANESLQAAAADGDNGQEADAVAATCAVGINPFAATSAAAWAKANQAADAAKVSQAEYQSVTRNLYEAERKEQAKLLRAIVGNPFRDS